MHACCWIITNQIYIHIIYMFSSAEKSEAESSSVEFDMVSTWLSQSELVLSSTTGCFKNQYIILAVSVRIIFWFTYINKYDTSFKCLPYKPQSKYDKCFQIFVSNFNYLSDVFRKQEYWTSKFSCNTDNVGCIHHFLLICII